MLGITLDQLHSESTLADLPAHDFRLSIATPGQAVVEELERQPELPGVMVDGEGSLPAVISRGLFFQHMSRGFSRELYLRRPLQFLLQMMPHQALCLSASNSIPHAARVALERPSHLAYEPLLIQGPRDTFRLLDARVLLLAQTQLLALANHIIQEQKDSVEQANRTLRETQAALCQSEKLASLGQLAAGMSHEINNPIAFVTNNVSVLHREFEETLRLLDAYHAALDPLAPEREGLAQLEEEMDLPYIQENYQRQFKSSLDGLWRVRNIVRNLCDFARLDQAERKEVDLNEALRSTLEMIGHEREKKKLQLVTCLETIPPILVQAGKINQVFLNLLINAVQACDPGGQIAVRTGQPSERELTVEVEDNGCGIPPEILPRLFEPFFTTKPVGQGTGLGLSISYGIVRDHGGKIEVESTPGQGSVFRIRLPLKGLRSGAPLVTMEDQLVPANGLPQKALV